MDLRAFRFANLIENKKGATKEYECVLDGMGEMKKEVEKKN